MSGAAGGGAAGGGAAPLVVPRRFRGPSASGNGGWTAGSLAVRLGGGPAVVRLSTPPPLGRPLEVARAGESLEVRAGEVLVATAAPAPRPEVDVPQASEEEAAAAARGYRGLVCHPFPECFACGPARVGEGDDAGLGLRPGPVGDGRTAAAWRVPDDVDAPVVWAALDCPGGWTVDVAGRPMVLGTMAAAVDRVPAPGTRCVVDGLLLEVSGRKVRTATALRTVDGELLAVATAVWVRLDPGR